MQVFRFSGSKMTKEQNTSTARLVAFSPADVMKEGYLPKPPKKYSLGSRSTGIRYLKN
jgi:hypothetical protein